MNSIYEIQSDSIRFTCSQCEQVFKPHPVSKTLCKYCCRLPICVLCDIRYETTALHHHTQIYTVCRRCLSTKRSELIKLKAIARFGGKCSQCGWNKHIRGMEFHHQDTSKEFCISESYKKTWEIITEEVDKCVLLCANCHRIEHARAQDDWINDVDRLKLF